MPWFKHYQVDGIPTGCASDACPRKPVWRLEAGEVASFYCDDCRQKIEAKWATGSHQMESAMREATVEEWAHMLMKPDTTSELIAAALSAAEQRGARREREACALIVEKLASADAVYPEGMQMLISAIRARK